jgi:hypothetical protein
MRTFKLRRDVSMGGGAAWKAGEVVQEKRVFVYQKGRRTGVTSKASRVYVTKLGQTAPYAEIDIEDLEPYTPPPPPPPPPPAELVADGTWGAF